MSSHTHYKIFCFLFMFLCDFHNRPYVFWQEREYLLQQTLSTKIGCYISTKRASTIKLASSSKRKPTALSFFTATLYYIKGSDNTLDLTKILKRRSIALKILGAFCATSSHGSYNAIHLFCMLRSYLHIMPFVIPPTSSLGSRLSAYKPCCHNRLQACFWAKMRFTSE